jgi:AcrR family transcriptional regulator
MPRRAKIRPDEPGQEKLLDAARALFGEQGYDATSIAEIGVRAGIAKSVLYHHFGSKAALYQAVIEEDGRALVDAVAAAVPPAGTKATPRLRPGLDAYLAFLSENPDAWRLMTRDPPRDPELRRIHESVAKDVGGALRALLAEPGKAKGKPHLVELSALAVRVYASWWRDHPEVPRAEVVAAIADVATAGAKRIGG